MKLVFQDLLESKELRSKRREMLQRLQNATHFTAKSMFEIATNLLTYGAVWNSDGTKVVVEKQGIIALVDSDFFIKQFGQSLAVFGKYKSALGSKAMSFHTARSVWLAKTNFYANIFASGLTSLFESGIYVLWFQHHFITRGELLFIIGMRRDEIIEIPQGEEATTLEQVLVVFVIYLSMALVSFTVFLVEFRARAKILLRNANHRISEYFRNLVAYPSFHGNSKNSTAKLGNKVPYKERKTRRIRIMSTVT